MDAELLSKAKEVFDCPSQLDTTINSSTLKHNEFKNRIIRDLEIKTLAFQDYIKEVSEGLVELQGVTSFDQYQFNIDRVRKLDNRLASIEEDRKDIND